MEQTNYYILFPSHTEGMKMDSLLSKNKIKHTIVPTPRELSKSCGICIMYNKSDESIIRKLIKDNEIKISGLHSLTKTIKSFYT
ncbi:DUF3343 domain-containing protein [Clostridium tepidum]|jgi:ribosomal protein L7Ae-like RNA K-turn-binding protein|uniref:Putative Se/S carrier protein-like domain-containing protein n=1 Tax=Clostridium tepidum TaxID=1962263 RepID=A0A1S9I3J1_9CLOT|nr:DUF3343 domain-containing protein [Clostridium tepidum]MCR1935565.1 DUF3343 domain-containing protein [Clostridium tepidum]MDU6878845.1 DUF3343 domain-containing protein [Clostridium botulinum]OOO61395.1 hypothetical protein BS637_12205 [Clostridium tepidum]OOO64856.1 hypothetical protein BS638_09750 [Clostridium tepidum]